MNDIDVLGGESAIYEADALSAFGSSADAAQTCELKVGLQYPNTEAGDNVYRRIHLPVQWNAGVSLTITPIVDGTELAEYQQVFTRSGSGRAEIVLPLNKRGAQIALRVVSGVPTGVFYLDTTAWIVFQPASASRSPAAA